MLGALGGNPLGAGDVLVVKIAERAVARSAHYEDRRSTRRASPGPRDRESAGVPCRGEAAADYNVKRASRKVQRAVHDSAKRSIFREEFASPTQQIGHPVPPNSVRAVGVRRRAPNQASVNKPKLEAAAVCSEGRIVSEMDSRDLSGSPPRMTGVRHPPTRFDPNPRFQ